MHGTRLLALGSFVLFVGSSLSLGTGWTTYFLAVCLFLPWAVALHAAAWYFLGEYAVRRDRLPIFAAFVGSLLIFGLSLSTLRSVEPSGFLLFPIVPWVWAPVVLAHVALYEFAARDLVDPRARRWSRAGTVVLASLAAIGLLGEFRIIAAGMWAFSFAGVTFLGYLLILVAWERGTQEVASPRYLPRGLAS